MGRKIFISYKYADSNVFPIAGEYSTTVRSYVDKVETYLDSTDNIYKGESDDEDLSKLTDEVIWDKLKDRIFDSSVTIVMISPCMKESGRLDRSQWIPWEISYSLKEMTRDEKTSLSNAVLAVVLPDKTGSYAYFIENYSCCQHPCRILKTNTLFEILGKNMFNRIESNKTTCKNNRVIHYGDVSYIQSVKWSDFTGNAQQWINKAVELQDRIGEYEIRKEV
jgi:hypothetical protein